MCNLRVTVPPSWLPVTPKSSAFHTQPLSPASACGQIQVPGLAGSVREGQLRSRGGLWGCLPEEHRRVEEREDQSPGSLSFYFFKRFLNFLTKGVGDGTTSLLQNEGSMLITGCLLPVLAPEKTKRGSVSFWEREKHTQKMRHCCVAC